MNYEVKIHAPNDLSEKWYVYIYSEGKVIKKFYKGLSKENNYTDRMLKAEILKSVIEKELSQGWKPTKKNLPQPYKEELTIEEAYGKALERINSLNLEEDTKKIYSYHYSQFLKAVENLKWKGSLFVELESYHFSLIIDEMTKMTGNGNAYYNNNLRYCKAFCKHLKDAFIIKENKALGLLSREHKAKEKKLLTSEQQTQIIEHFNNVLPEFNVYLKTLYHLAIRPKELRLLKCSMLNTEGKIWFFELPEEITKNNKKGMVLVPKDLQKDLMEFDLSNPDAYIFGKIFRPSIKPQAENRANMLWKKEVKEKLGIQSDMYWLKSKSSNDKMRNGMSLEAVRIANRHSDKEVTKIYATESDLITLEQNLDKFGKFE